MLELRLLGPSRREGAYQTPSSPRLRTLAIPALKRNSGSRHPCGFVSKWPHGVLTMTDEHQTIADHGSHCPAHDVLHDAVLCSLIMHFASPRGLGVAPPAFSGPWADEDDRQ